MSRTCSAHSSMRYYGGFQGAEIEGGKVHLPQSLPQAIGRKVFNLLNHKNGRLKNFEVHELRKWAQFAEKCEGSAK